MTIANIAEREQWVESEFKKWEEEFIVPFELEFNVKALLDMRYLFLTTPSEHTRTKIDLLRAMEHLQDSFMGRLKKKTKYEMKPEVLIAVNNKFQKQEISDLFERILGEAVIKANKLGDSDKYETSSVKITIKPKTSDFKGYRFNSYLNLTGDTEFEFSTLVPITRSM